MKIVCSESAVDIATHFTIALGQQIAEQFRASEIPNSQTRLKLGFCKYEMLLQVPQPTAILPGIVAAAREHMTINDHVIGPMLRVAWQCGHCLNPLLCCSDRLLPAAMPQQL